MHRVIRAPLLCRIASQAKKASAHGMYSNDLLGDPSSAMSARPVMQRRYAQTSSRWFGTRNSPQAHCHTQFVRSEPKRGRPQNFQDVFGKIACSYAQPCHVVERYCRMRCKRKGQAGTKGMRPSNHLQTPHTRDRSGHCLFSGNRGRASCCRLLKLGYCYRGKDTEKLLLGILPK